VFPALRTPPSPPTAGRQKSEGWGIQVQLYALLMVLLLLPSQYANREIGAPRVARPTLSTISGKERPTILVAHAYILVGVN
jgi:hypothetical protein